MDLESGIYFQNFSRQSGFLSEFVFNRNFPIDINFTVGLSGNSVFKHNIKSGLIFNNNDNIIFSLNYDTDTILSINSSSGVVISYINNIPVSYENIGSAYFDYLYFSGDQSSSINYKFSGEVPRITFSQLNNFSGYNNIITGQLVNDLPARVFQITGAYIQQNEDLVEVSGYTTGNISSTGYIWLQADSGIEYPTGEIGLVIFTNFKTLNYTLNSDSVSLGAIYDEYLELSPQNDYLSSFDRKEFNLTSYFNFGPNREISVKLENISGGPYLPEYVTHGVTGTGILTGLITGSGNLTGTLTGVYTGNSATGYSGYSQPYVFIGNFVDTKTGTITGTTPYGTVTGTASTGYNVTLVSGDLGYIELGEVTGLISGWNETFSGYKSADFTISGTGGASAMRPYLYLSGYSGSYTNTTSGNRNSIVTSGLHFSVTISGIDSSETGTVIFDFAEWWYQPSGTTGVRITGYDASNHYGILDSGSLSGMVSTNIYMYTGLIPSGSGSHSSDPSINSYVGSNVSGIFHFYIGTYDSFSPPMVPAGPWTITNFTLFNLPVHILEDVTTTGTGLFNWYITGDVSEGYTGILYDEFLESTGNAVFLDTWNLKTGTSSFTYTDFNYFNLYSGENYINTGSKILALSNTLNNFFIGIDHIGTNVSGFNKAKLTIEDGTLTGEYYITGRGEYYA